MSVLHACVYVFQMCARCPQRSEEVVGSPDTGITDSWEPACGGLEQNLGLLQEKQGCFTTESSLHLCPSNKLFINYLSFYFSSKIQNSWLYKMSTEMTKINTSDLLPVQGVEVVTTVVIFQSQLCLICTIVKHLVKANRY